MELTRTAAARLQQRRFYTGRPCKHGHDSPRWTATGACVECAKLSRKQWGENIRKLLRGEIA